MFGLFRKKEKEVVDEAVVIEEEVFDEAAVIDKETGITSSNPDYRDVEVAFEVDQSKMGINNKRIVNIAEITDDNSGRRKCCCLCYQRQLRRHSERR